MSNNNTGLAIFDLPENLLTDLSLEDESVEISGGLSLLYPYGSYKKNKKSKKKSKKNQDTPIIIVLNIYNNNENFNYNDITASASSGSSKGY
jgi:hypothetical protein